MRFGTKLAMLVGLTAMSGGAAAQKTSPHDPFCKPEAAKIMILGTYHMDDAGLDATSLNADDVLAPKRQAQIKEVVDRLARYRPTKIMVEWPYRSNATAPYKQYLEGTRELRRNEVEQIGYRLGKMLGHQKIIPVDFPMRMSGYRPDEVDDSWRPKAAPNPAPAAQPEKKPVPPANDPAAQMAQRLRSSTLREFLLYVNGAQRSEAEHSYYYSPMYLPEDSAALYARSDLMVNWYKRNIRMFANIARETKFPEDRVLMIVGSGHLKILRDFAAEADYFCLVEPSEYLG
jgi:hypothetical protein